MSRYGTLLANDIRKLSRDFILIYSVVATLMLVLLTRWFVPRIVIPEIGPLVPYYPVIVAMLAFYGPIVYGFIAGFMLLDEKDDNVAIALRVLPLPTSEFIGYRMLLATAGSFVFSIIAMVGTGLAPIPVPAILAAAVLIATEGPLLALFLASYAGSKVEGLAILKVASPLFLLPLASFFIAAPWHYVMAVIPMYWPTRIIFLAMEGATWWPHLLVGVVVHVLFLREFVRRFGDQVL